jgi:hypothetical protein
MGYSTFERVYNNFPLLSFPALFLVFCIVFLLLVFLFKRKD